jgi:hypothetical protein
MERTVNVYAMTTEIPDMGGNTGGQAAAGEVCWNYLEYDTVSWSGNGPVAGTEYTTTHGASATIADGSVATTIKWNVTDIVQDWSNGMANYGFILRGDDWAGDDNRHGFFSNDCGTNDLPYLKVTYTPEPATMTLLLSGGGLALLRRKK